MKKDEDSERSRARINQELSEVLPPAPPGLDIEDLNAEWYQLTVSSEGRMVIIMPGSVFDEDYGKRSNRLQLLQRRLAYKRRITLRRIGQPRPWRLQLTTVALVLWTQLVCTSLISIAFPNPAVRSITAVLLYLVSLRCICFWLIRAVPARLKYRWLSVVPAILIAIGIAISGFFVP